MHMKWDYIDIQIKLWVRRFCLAANNLVGISFKWTSILRTQNSNKHTSTSTKSQLCVKLLWLNVKLRILTELRFNYETNIIYNCLRYLACLWFFFDFNCHLLLSIRFLEQYRERRRSKQLYIQTKYRSKRNNGRML